MKILKTQLLTTLTLIALSFTFSAFAQDRCEYIPPLETRHWLFGRNIGLVFNDSYNIQPYSGSDMHTTAGSAVMSDEHGNLIFYTNGRTVWDRRHIPMPNGQNLVDQYFMPPTQAALILPRPGSNTQYYLFLTDDPERQENQGFRYCVIDMTLNDGYGDIMIESKNILLLDQTSEKLTAVRHANGVDYWLVTHGWENNRFFVLRVTSSLPQSSDFEIYNIGAIHSAGGLPNSWNSKGYMKISPKGDKLASVIHLDGIVELFDFNNQTGAVTNRRVLSQNYYRAYGLEFSPDGQYFYFTTLMTTTDTDASELYQVNTSTMSVSTIAIPSHSSSTFAGLQLGMDSKIYVIRSNRGGQNFNTSIGVIENPKRPGIACNFTETLPGFSNQYFQNGFPNFMVSYFDIPHFTYYRHCEGDDVVFSLWNSSNTTSTTWNFGAGAITTPGTSYTLLYDQAGNYQNISVMENGTFGPYFEDIFIRPLPVLIPELPPDEDVLLIFPNTIYPLDGGEGFYEYYWYSSTSPDGPWQLVLGGIGDAYRFLHISDEGFYKLEVVDMECCENERIFQVRSLDLKMPTAFRPFSVNVENRTFRPYGGPVLNYSLNIYNRWGQLVYSEEIPVAREQGLKGNGWDGVFQGKMSPAGVYAYIVIFDVEHEEKLIKTTKRGWFMLLQ